MLAASSLNEIEEIETDEYLPRGKYIKLPGRGRCFYREHKNPGKPTLMLLHGMIASSGLNWFKCYEPLSKHFHIVAPDLR
ncbi:MAG: alpha/beta fold hydrolase, partial [Pseudomonadales bacterium]